MSYMHPDESGACQSFHIWYDDYDDDKDDDDDDDDKGGG